MKLTAEQAIELSNGGTIYDKFGKPYTVKYTSVEYVGGIAEEIMFETTEGLYIKEAYVSQEDLPEYVKSFDKYRIELVSKYGRDTRDSDMMDIFRVGFEAGRTAKLVHNAQEQLGK